jgi:proliferating cell nuclear antigen
MSEYSVYFKTVQSSAIRTLVEALKEVLNDVNMTFHENGIKIMAMDGTKVALVHLKLVASSFEEWVCEKTQQVGVNMLSLFKLLKTIGTNDTLCMFIKKSDPNRLGIQIDNKDKGMQIVSYLNLLDINEDVIQIPDVEFDSVITMQSNDFQKLCRDMLPLHNILKITSTNGEFVLSVKGDFAEQSIKIGETVNGLTFSKQMEANKVVEGDFDLKYINLFTKSTNLCSTIEIFIRQNYPLILLYSVANLGSLKFCLAPKTED